MSSATKRPRPVEVPKEAGTPPSAKKTKTTMKSGPIIDLSRDEISSVMTFLAVGESLMLSLTCKTLYESVEAVAKNLVPFGVKPSWSIANALKEHLACTIYYSSEMEKLKTILDSHEGSYQIPKHLVFLDRYHGDLTPQDILKVVGQETTADKKEFRVVKVDWTDDSIKTSMDSDEADYEHLFEKTIEKVSVTRGFGIKNLVVNNQKCPRMEIYRILSHCPNLESLNLQVTEDGIYTLGLMKNSEEGEEEEEEETKISNNGVTIPVLANLKKLAVISCYDYDAGMQFIIDLLQLTPNLESLEYAYHNSPDDMFLKFLADQCPNLRELIIRGVDGATPMENLFTDDGIVQFLDKVPSLTSLVLYHSCQVSGEIFTKIGKYAQLKTLFIERRAMNEDLVDQYDNIHFGGGVLESLESLILAGSFEDLPENFVDSIIKTAPNLKRFHHRLEDIDFAKLYKKCEKLTHISLNLSGKLLDETMDALVLNKHLRSLVISAYQSDCASPLTIERLKRCNWSDLRELKLDCFLPDEPEQWPHTLVKACPNLTVLSISGHFRKDSNTVDNREKFNKALLDVLSDSNNWPDLKMIIAPEWGEDFPFESKLATLRPFVSTNESVDHRRFLKKVEAPQSEYEFIYDWLITAPTMEQDSGYGRRYYGFC